MTLVRLFSIIALLLLLLVVIGCSGSPPTVTPTPTATPTATPAATPAQPASGSGGGRGDGGGGGGNRSGQSATAIAVFRDGTQVATLDDAALRQLPAVPIGGDEGPTLPSVLAHAGTKDFEQVRIVGMSVGRAGPAELVLTKDQVTDRVILDFTNRGTMKLAASDIPRDQWVLDITRIELE